MIIKPQDAKVNKQSLKQLKLQDKGNNDWSSKYTAMKDRKIGY
jgi:hypothetical protein